MRRNPRNPRVLRVPPLVLAVSILLSALTAPASWAQQAIPTPEQFFGFAMGADRKLARWDRLVEYYELLVVSGVATTEFWSPGSTLHVRVDNENPLAWGMPSEALATFLAGNQAYEVVASERNERVERIVTFPDRDILQSGWLLGEDRIANRAAMVSVQRGRGRVVLIGFRAQHRAQTHGTFKLVFNALLGAARGENVSADGGV